LPESYEGDWSEMQNFLMQFRRYILMNRGTEIAKDPFKRCGLFLSLMKGPKVKGWVQKTYDWLDQVETNPDSEFLPGSNPGRYSKESSTIPSLITQNTNELKMNS
jgi:hypothetical protein